MSFIETIPEISETKINGNTIIFNKMIKTVARVVKIFSINKFSINALGIKKIFNKSPKKMPKSIE